MIDISAIIYQKFVQCGFNPKTADILDQIVILLGIALLAYLLDLVIRKGLITMVEHLVKKTKNQYDDFILTNGLLDKLAVFGPIILVYILLPIAFSPDSDILLWSRKFCLVFIVINVISSVFSGVDILRDIAEFSKRFKGKSLGGFFQLIKVITFCLGCIIVVSILIDKSPTTLFAGLGASAAVLMLVFKDTIVGFVSGIQLSANNMLRINDWITCKKHGINGVVTEISLNTVKVRNYDNTIVTIPPYTLISDSFQNWRNMQENGSRRIKRSLKIDMHTVKFCSQEMLDRFAKIKLIKDYIKSINTKDNKTSNITNLTIFRQYLNAFIENYPNIDKSQLYMIRHGEPTETGLPVEIYFFTTKFKWVEYENDMADVFDHIIAMVPVFELSVFQSITDKSRLN